MNQKVQLQALTVKKLQDINIVNKSFLFKRGQSPNVIVDLMT